MTTTAGTLPPSESAALALQVVGDSRKRALDPVDRFSEVIFGLIMVLTFTGALSVAQSGREDVRQMLVAALTCNLAWGLVDGVMYVLTSIAGRARGSLVLRGIRAADPATARAILMGGLPEGVALITSEAEADRMVASLRDLPELRRQVGITVPDLRGAVASCLLVVLATLPPTLPFFFIVDTARALRISNLLAVISLFVTGYYLGKATGLNAWLLGLAMTLLGSALVAITIALGG